MSQVGTVAWLAVRELWISFRLLAVLVAFIGAGAIVALMPAPPSVTLTRLGLGLGLATIVAAGVAAWSIANERTHGRAGWLVTRSVARGTYLGGWFMALAVAITAGIGAAGALGWLTIAGVPTGLEGTAFSVAFVAVGATALAAVALALAVGSLLRATPALALVVVLCGGIGAVAWLVPGVEGILPGSAFVALPSLAGQDPDLAVALRAAGIGLILTAVMLAAARVALERAEL